MSNNDNKDFVLETIKETSRKFVEFVVKELEKEKKKNE